MSSQSPLFQNLVGVTPPPHPPPPPAERGRKCTLCMMSDSSLHSCKCDCPVTSCEINYWQKCYPTHLYAFSLFLCHLSCVFRNTTQRQHNLYVFLILIFLSYALTTECIEANCYFYYNEY